MSYVGAYYNYDTDAVMVWERSENGRKITAHYAPWYFYVPDENGEHTSIYGDKLKRLDFESKAEFEAACRAHNKKFESDISPLYKVLMDEYYDLPIPDVHYAFYDIEVDTKATLGWATPENPYAPINAVTIWQSWTKNYLTYAVPPKGGVPVDFEEKFAALWEEHRAEYKLGVKPTIVFCSSEAELLSRKVDDFQDADIISGWNSEFFDLPYSMKRIERVSPKLADKMSFIGCKPPKAGTVVRFGSPALTYSLNGRTHLDSLDLFKKFTFEGRTSYSLESIASDELGVSKLHYDGTLEQLYNKDFARFILYNIIDVNLLVRLDEKFKFIALVNQMAHENCVLFQNMLGTVRYVETGITNRAHKIHNLLVADKRILTDGEKVEGAVVLSPLVGLHDWVATIDVKGLYPSVIRSLNISPEKFVGQFTNGEADWRGIMAADDELHTLLDRDKETVTATGAQWKQLLFDNAWALSAYGTIFDQSSGLGILPETLAFWATERDRLVAEKKKYTKLAKEETDPVKKAEYAQLQHHFDLLQLTKKISSNSAYGALLSAHFRLGRKEMGGSVTACGRQVTTFILETVSKLVTGKPTKIIKDTFIEKDGSISNVYTSNSEVLLASDTDSCMFKTLASSKEEAIAIADFIAEEMNTRFAKFMRDNFNCQPGYDDIIRVNREVVGSKALFLNVKKKYTIKVVNLEGIDLEPPKLKVVGSEMKKADTPKVIQDFLKNLMHIILDGGSYEEVEKYINSQRGTLIRKVKDLVVLGVSKQINNLDAKYAEWSRTEKAGNGKVNLPGHVRAAVNYNELVQEYDKSAPLLRAGDKGLIFYLQPNERGLKTIAFPADIDQFPRWFLDNFQLDRKLTEQKMIDQKLKRIFEALNWEIPTPQKTFVKSILKF